MNLGKFIVLDGPEGGGKTTQAKLLVDRLKAEGVPVLNIREPGGTELSEAIRGVLLNVKYKSMPPISELLLFLAARTSLVQEVIKPALKNKILVIADRFSPATHAYQFAGRGLSESLVNSVNDFAVGGLQIDLYVKLMVDWQMGLRRKKDSGKLDRIELEEESFHKRVYNDYWNFWPDATFCREVDSTHRSITKVHQEIYLEIKKHFPDFFPV